MESMHHSLIKQALSYIEKDQGLRFATGIAFQLFPAHFVNQNMRIIFAGARSSRGGVNICIFATFSGQC